ncbi:MAG: Verru_Chthon cassette protein A [Candidatus Methylacidiphilales bacterium]|nr:Verru_Chthon cassette protein A [Candidatus Methylacidiphilales bacterium]
MKSSLRNLKLQRQAQQGSALLIVLAVLLLLTTLVVGLLLRAGYEQGSAAGLRAVGNTSALTDRVVNLVQAQINEATTLDPNNAWASQPGAIRVFDDNGDLRKIFRLYSSAAVDPDITDGTLLNDDVPPASWASSPALWSDLNAPARTREADGTYTVQFPILDPRDPQSPGTNDAPSVISSSKLKGFYLGKIPGYSGASGTSGATDVPGATTAQPIPMPVQWLYVLQDGKMVAPGAGSSGNIAIIPTASAENPIVGRIAYWTDDECTKVNINTAAGNARGDGTYASWDTPHFISYQDYNYFALSMPLSKEYQRYSGHPATTNLYDILNGLGYNTGYPASYPGNQGAASPFFTLLPYYNDDQGSKQAKLATTANNQTGTLTPTVKTERLYTSLAELLYNKDRTANDGTTLNRNTLETGKFFLTTQSRAPEVTLYGTPRISMWPVDTTVTSNAASKPRVSVYDTTVAFCSSVGKDSSGKRFPYFIQKSNSSSATNDYDNIPRNQQLFDYLLKLSSMDIPGFGGNFASKYNVANEWDQIVTEMFDFIRCINLKDLNLASGNYFSPGGQVTPLQINRGGIKTQGLGRYFTISEVGLLVVCTADGNGTAPGTNGSANDWRTVSNVTVAGTKLKNSTGVMVGPDGTINTSFSPNPTLSSDGKFYPIAAPSYTALNSGQKRLQAMLLLEPSAPLMGSQSINPAYKVRVTGLNDLTFVGGSPSKPFPSSNESKNVLIPASYRLSSTYYLGGTLGMQWMTAFNTSSSASNSRVSGWENQTASATRYPFVSDPFTISANTSGSTMSVSGTITVEVFIPATYATSTTTTSPTIAPTDVLVQTITLTFPSASAPVPDLLQYGLSTPTLASDWWGFGYRISASGGGSVSGSTPNFTMGSGSIIRTDNVADTAPVAGWTLNSSYTSIPIKSSSTSTTVGSDTTLNFMCLDGDYRLTAAKGTLSTAIPSGGATRADYVKHELYGLQKLAHSFTQWSGSNRVTGYAMGKLARMATYEAAWLSKVPISVSADVSNQGDWDNGWPGNPDGAYAGKPDEGNLNSAGASGAYATPYYGSIETQSNNVKYFSPNRIVSSAVAMGSLPTGVKQNIPWRTLCFRPQMYRPLDPAIGPKDYLILDLFQMPIVDPYAISEPLSTAGKINMNYAIVPFSYITRSTGVRAVLSSEMVARVPASKGTSYKGYSGGVPATSATSPARLPIYLSEVDGALRQFQERFSSGDIFRSPAEICSIYLPPDSSSIGGNTYKWTTDKDADTAWYLPTGDFALVGDNVRERPYACIYPRLTTKSNTFKVYYTVQALKKPRVAGADPTRWDESTGVVEGEFRGSTTLERYIDPENPNLKDFASDFTLFTPGNANAKTLDSYYQWRIIANNAFPQ